MNHTTRRHFASLAVGLAIGVMICSAVHAAPSLQFGPIYPKGPAQPDKARLTDGAVVVDCVLKVVDTKGGVQPLCDLMPFGMWLGVKVFGLHAGNAAGNAPVFGVALTGARSYYMQTKTLNGKPARQAVMSDILTHYTKDPAPANPPALPGSPPPVVVAPPEPPVTPGVGTWVQVATEHASFSHAGPVRFGLDGFGWVEKTAAGYFMCNGAAEWFGADPAPGAAKVCQALQ